MAILVDRVENGVMVTNEGTGKTWVAEVEFLESYSGWQNVGQIVCKALGDEGTTDERE